MEYIILDNRLHTDDYIRLFAAAGWGEPPRDMTEKALKNSYATFSVEADGRVIAMARLLGDGAMSFFLKDFVVEPQMQGRGIGKALLAHIEEYIRLQLENGWAGYLQLVSSKGKEGFYHKMGFAAHPNEHSGPAMSKWIR
ncbi:MAG: GNAT family N-acetyltransferase [Eubacteriales bacterium]|nr:GNAT family N-acetyltransferase [Eubacteriales bacterium]